ncbi:MAG: hypothetical protein V4591_07015 [Bdellovibrionota bacterium]
MASAVDDDTYTFVINMLAEEARKPEVIYNTFTLKALAQAVWRNESKALTSEELGRLIELVTLKIEPNIVSVSLFNDLIAVMAAAKVAGIPKDKLDGLQSKLKDLKEKIKSHQHLEMDEREELLLKIDFAYQTSILIGSDEAQLKAIQRKLCAFSMGLLQIGIAAGGFAGAALTVGGIAALSVPASVKTLIDSFPYFQEALRFNTEKTWYKKFIVLKNSLIEEMYGGYTQEKANILVSDLQKLPSHIQFGIAETLGDIIRRHPDQAVKGICVGILANHVVQVTPGIKLKILRTVAELAQYGVLSDEQVNQVVSTSELKDRFKKIPSMVLQDANSSGVGDLVTRAQLELAAGSIPEQKQGGLSIVGLDLQKGSIAPGCEAEFEDINGFVVEAFGASEQERICAVQQLQEVTSKASEITGASLKEGSIPTGTKFKMKGVSAIKFSVGQPKGK